MKVIGGGEDKTLEIREMGKYEGLGIIASGLREFSRKPYDLVMEFTSSGTIKDSLML